MSANPARTSSGAPLWHRAWPAAVVVALAALVLIRALRDAGFTFDDAYITYRYAENLAAGRGFTYNPGERVLGTTTPLYTLLLAALDLIELDLPRASVVLGGLMAAGSVVLVWALGREDGATLAGLIAAAWLALDPLPYLTLGMETTTYTGLCLLALYLQRQRQPTLSALAAGLAFLTRWDGVLVGGIILLAEWRQTRRLPWRMAAVLLAVIGPWLIFAQLYFGSIFPNTFFAKFGQTNTGLLGGGAMGFGEGLLRTVQARLAESAAYWLVAAGLALGVARLVRRPAPWWPVAAWTGLYTAGYTALGVANFHWYYAPLMPGLALLLGSGVAGLASGLERRLPVQSGRGGPVAVRLAIAAGVLWPQAGLFQRLDLAPAPNLSAYAAVGRWLNEHSPPGSTVALLEIGVVGYLSQRTVIDMMGLVTPSMIGHLEGWDQVQAYAIANNWPDYVLALGGALPDRLGREPDSWFAQAYVPATTTASWGEPAQPMTLYARRPGFPPAEWTTTWPAGFVFDQSFELTGLAADAAQLEPGMGLAVRLEWHVLRAVEEDYQFDFELVQLTTGERWVLDAQSTPFYGGSPTHQWRPGRAFSEIRRLVWPADAPPGAYRLLIRAFRQGLEVLPANSATGRSQTAMSGVLTSGSTPSTTPFAPLPLSLADGVHLLGAALAPAPAGWALELHWQAEQPPATDYTVFVHFYDAQGNLLSQHDSPPAEGRLPTTWWAAGIPVVDAHPIAGSVDAITRFCVGMYEPMSLARLPVVNAGRFDVADNVACHALPELPP